jgi:hypothetical protein
VSGGSTAFILGGRPRLTQVSVIIGVRCVRWRRPVWASSTPSGSGAG